jgi:matrixin
VSQTAVLAVVLSFAAAQTEPLSSPHWAKGEVIRVWIETRSAPADGPGLVERAMRTWTDAAAGRFTLTRAASRDGSPVRVFFISSNTNYGETAPHVDRAKRTIVSAEVAINADVPADALTAHIILYLTALHELGHALGLPHTDEFADIMYRFRRPDDGERYFGAFRQRLRSADDIGSASASGLSPADVAALRQLYDR